MRRVDSETLILPNADAVIRAQQQRTAREESRERAGARREVVTVPPAVIPVPATEPDFGRSPASPMAPWSDAASQTTTFKFPVDGEMTQFTRWGSGKKLVVFFNNNGVDFGPDDPGRLRPFDKMPKNIEGALQAYTSLMDEGYSLVVWDYPFIPRFSRPFFLEVSHLQQVEGKPDFSGIASSVVEGIRKETGATEMILVGNSMGGGVLLWDLDKIASMDGVRTLLLSPTEFFMPPIDRLSGSLPNTTLISIAPDPYLQSPEFKAWAAKHASPPGGALEEDLGEDSNHLIIGRDRLTHKEVARLIQQAAQLTNRGGSDTAITP
jgi:hypothetical protein